MNKIAGSGPVRGLQMNSPCKFHPVDPSTNLELDVFFNKIVDIARLPRNYERLKASREIISRDANKAKWTFIIFTTTMRRRKT